MAEENRKNPFCNLNCPHHEDIEQRLKGVTENRDELKKKAPIWLVVLMITLWAAFAGFTVRELGHINKTVTRLVVYQESFMKHLNITP
ncbi:MAG: hypothetical protein GY774_35415 [Planctomycetes bacterium]|nr:hypothetical protein [Planctomycetota bacterium]